MGTSMYQRREKQKMGSGGMTFRRHHGRFSVVCSREANDHSDMSTIVNGIDWGGLRGLIDVAPAR